MKVTLQSGNFGWDYVLKCEDGRTQLVQLDYDYPGLASNFGWCPDLVQKPTVPFVVKDGAKENVIVFQGTLEQCVSYISHKNSAHNSTRLEGPGLYILPDKNHADYCAHDGTDGTIGCECGISASTFIQHAQKWLDDHEGEEFNDPGYFRE